VLHGVLVVVLLLRARACVYVVPHIPHSPVLARV